jgi:hypothetical protein
MASFSVAPASVSTEEPEPSSWQFPHIPGPHEPLSPGSRWCRACTERFRVGVLFPCLSSQAANDLAGSADQGASR